MEKLNLRGIKNIIGNNAIIKVEEKNENNLFYSFDINNSYITVIRNYKNGNFDSYGAENGLFELGIHTDYNIQVMGFLTAKQVLNVLQAINIYGAEYILTFLNDDNCSYEELEKSVIQNNSIIYEV